MGKILVIGDPHFKSTNLNEMSSMSLEILEIIKKEKIKLCIILGDTLDNHDKIDMRCLYGAINWFNSISEHTKLVVLIGNHDRQNNQDFLSKIHPFISLETNSNIQIISTTKWDKEYNFIYVPYVPPGKYFEALEKVNYDPRTATFHPKYIFSHQEFKGCKMGTINSEKGDYWDSSFPLNISGHIHEYQTLNSVIYVGTFYQENFGESSDKAILLIEQDESGKNRKERMKRIKLKTFVPKITLTLKIEQIKDYVWPEGRIKVILLITSNELKSIYSNPDFILLKKKVELIKLKIVDKAVEPEQKQQDSEPKVQTIEEIMCRIVKNDQKTYDIFLNEIV